MFEVGDEVYSKRFGEGVVTDVDDNDLYIYPIHVQWKNSCKRSIFTPEGKYNIHFNDPDVDICLLKVGKFKVGDHVYSKHFGEGVVEHIDDPKTNTYPVQVYWIGAVPRSFNSCEFYTPDGVFNKLYPQPDNDIIKKKDAKFKVGDRVYSQFAGVGEILKIGANENLEYPIQVKWCNQEPTSTFAYDFFTRDGRFYSDRKNMIKDIVPVEEVDIEFKEKNDGTVERMEDALNKKVEDAVNPSHYKVKGLPEAIDIINHLMHHDQYEGFFWGNILKYAYRYGRKGDKAETAGKIEWYARQLKELCECEAEKEEGDKKRLLENS